MPRLGTKPNIRVDFIEGKSDLRLFICGNLRCVMLRLKVTVDKARVDKKWF